ncbi:hypothetical protein [Rhodohalobacter sp. 614A]|uniref:hypothetical protein n=1 Tax=Rhodohalobacter sp. 614A TaxID=2908649 RepID=UPI001F1FF439|nr:hypothetical protein [Rhodohalobacter sp. 614A]
MEILIIIGIIIIAWWLFKSNNNSTSSSHGIDNIYYSGAQAVISIIDSHIQMQGGKDSLPAKAKDSYSLGYIAGMLDASLHNLAQKNLEKFIEVLSFTLNSLFGNSEGKRLILKVFDLLENPDQVYYKAMEDGGNEFLDFIRGNIHAPTGWAWYIMDHNF